MPNETKRSIAWTRSAARCVVLGLIRSAATNETLRPSIASTERTQSIGLHSVRHSGGRYPIQLVSAAAFGKRTLGELARGRWLFGVLVVTLAYERHHDDDGTECNRGRNL